MGHSKIHETDIAEKGRFVAAQWSHFFLRNNALLSGKTSTILDRSHNNNNTIVQLIKKFTITIF